MTQNQYKSSLGMLNHYIFPGEPGFMHSVYLPRVQVGGRRTGLGVTVMGRTLFDMVNWTIV